MSGVVIAAAARRGLPVALHTPSEVKAAVTGHGRAGKDQVGAMVARLLGLSEVPKPADAADALALAICHVWRGRRTGEVGERGDCGQCCGCRERCAASAAAASSGVRR